MRLLYSLSLLFISFSSCYVAKFEYVGSSEAPTQKVDVFVDAAAIKRSYDIIGKGYEKPGLGGAMNLEKMQAEAIKKAKKKGADAIFYREIYISTNGGTAINTRAQTDSIYRGIVTTSSTSITPVTGYWHKEILFLKYR